MKRSQLVLLAGLSFAVSGCVLADFVFAAFASAYSGGGTTEIERKQHFDQQWEAASEMARKEEHAVEPQYTVPSPLPAAQ